MRLPLVSVAAALASGRPVLHASALRPTMSAAVSPPVARRVPHTVSFGRVAGENRGASPMDPPIERADDLFWIRDDARKDEEVLGLLRAENGYTQARTARLAPFRDALYAEMLSHVEEDDDTHPSPAADGYEYWSRTVKGASFRQYLRRARGSDAEEMLLDVNEVSALPFFADTPGWDAAQCDVRGLAPSPSGALLAYAVDGSGYETYNVRVRDAATGRERDEQIVGTAGSVAWAGDSTLFYTKFDHAHRPFQVWRHALGSDQADDALVYEDADELFNVGVAASRDGALVFVESASKETTELHFIPTDRPRAAPTLVRARRYGVRYDADSHAPSRSLFLTSNAGGSVNRELLVASLDAPAEWAPVRVAGGGGAPVLAHSASRSLGGVAAFADFLAVTGREGGFTQCWVVPLAPRGAAAAAAGAHRLAFDADAFTVGLASNLLFESGGKLRVDYSSMTSPPALLEFDVASRAYATLKTKPVPNYDASLYRTARTEVAARDGEAIPVTLLWRPDAVGDAMAEGGGGAPCHLYGYGSYGICMDPSFSASVLPLVDRGVVYAIAHVRGGGEMGHHKWCRPRTRRRRRARAIAAARSF